MVSSLLAFGIESCIADYSSFVVSVCSFDVILRCGVRDAVRDWYCILPFLPDTAFACFGIGSRAQITLRCKDDGRTSSSFGMQLATT